MNVNVSIWLNILIWRLLILSFIVWESHSITDNLSVYTLLNVIDNDNIENVADDKSTVKFLNSTNHYTSLINIIDDHSIEIKSSLNDDLPYEDFEYFIQSLINLSYLNKFKSYNVTNQPFYPYHVNILLQILSYQ